VHLLSQLTRAKGMTELLSLLDLLSDAILLVLFSSKIVFNELALHSKMAKHIAFKCAKNICYVKQCDKETTNWEGEK
jgi:putative salt-induced outer membrane protein YdiY